MLGPNGAEVDLLLVDHDHHLPLELVLADSPEHRASEFLRLPPLVQSLLLGVYDHHILIAEAILLLDVVGQLLSEGLVQFTVQTPVQLVDDLEQLEFALLLVVVA